MKNNKTQKTFSKTDIIRMIAFIIGIVIIGISIAGLTKAFLKSMSTKISYSEAEDSYFSEDEFLKKERTSKTKKKNTSDVSDNIFGDTTHVSADSDQPVNWWEYAYADIPAMHEKYPCVVAWIYFENEEISYPIVYSKDNSTYLRTNYKGKAENSGSIFIDGLGSSNLDDILTVIYGHNMKDLSMFGKLKYYKTKKDYYNGHEYFQIFTPDAVYRYEIFAYGNVPVSSDLYAEETMGRKSADTTIFKVIEYLKSKSLIKSDFSPQTGDHIVCLSTCSANETERFVVTAARIAEHSY